MRNLEGDRFEFFKGRETLGLGIALALILAKVTSLGKCIWKCLSQKALLFEFNTCQVINIWIISQYILRDHIYKIKLYCLIYCCFGFKLDSWTKKTQQKAQEQTKHMWKLEIWQLGHFILVGKEKPIQHGDETIVYPYDK